MLYKNLVGYTAQCTNKKSKRHLKNWPWRTMLSPFRPNKKIVGDCIGYAIDNGAFVYGSKGLPFNEYPFLKDVECFGKNSDFIVIPDVLYNSYETLLNAEKWINKLGKEFNLLLVAQNGMKPKDIEYYTQKNIGIFIGGSTDWKLNNCNWIADTCNRHDVICHMGRVNSRKRINICLSNNVHSFDGSNPARYENEAEHLTRYLIELDNQLFCKNYNVLTKWLK